jgi:hypothetical protein
MMELIRRPETSVSNHHTPRNNTEDGLINFNRGESLRTRVEKELMCTCNERTPGLERHVTVQREENKGQKTFRT